MLEMVIDSCLCLLICSLSVLSFLSFFLWVLKNIVICLASKTNSLLILVCTSCSYLPGLDDTLVLDIAYKIYLKFEELTSALWIALFLDNLQVHVVVVNKFY
jgi:hypothetical protein